MLSRVTFVAVLLAWAIYLTYTATAALVAGVPHLPEAPRAALLAGLVTALLIASGALLLQRTHRRIVAELRRALAEAFAAAPMMAPEPPPAVPAVAGYGEQISVAYLSDAAELYELGRQAERQRREPPMVA